MFTYKQKLSTVSMLSAGIFCLGAQAEVISKEEVSWYQNAQKEIESRLKIDPIKGQAKNVILFIADGNGVVSNTAVRLYAGQKKSQDGEGYQLSYEAYPVTGLIKTYNTNAQTPDSAGTATALMSGVKTRSGVLGVGEGLKRGKCEDVAHNRIASLAEVFEEQGKSTGIVSTARLTHATPASVYAHSADRNYEGFLPKDCTGQKDIALQLLEWPAGDGLEIALGGGRANFLPAQMKGPEGKKGKRKDGRNLIEEWQAKGAQYKYVWDQAGFDALQTDSDDKILGLFNGSHMEYELDRAQDKGGEPSLAQMTKTAIERLNNNEKGYFLMIEAGRVDHAHHAGNAARALEDGVSFEEAVKIADEMTKDEDTLIIVTADHSHAIAFSGYSMKGNNILGLARTADGPKLALDGKPYTTIGYLNGQGALLKEGAKGHHKEGHKEEDSTSHSHNSPERQDLTHVDVTDKDYVQQSLIPLGSETHGADDVAVYAKGPWAHLLSGVSEQNMIYHVMDYAASQDRK